MMENNNRQIDDLFKKSFEQIQFNDADQHWDDVYTHLETKKKRKKGFYWMKWIFISMMLIGLTIVGIYGIKNNSSAIDNKNNNPSEPIARLGQPNITPINKKIVESIKVEEIIEDDTLINKIKALNNATTNQRINTSTTSVITFNTQHSNSNKEITIDNNNQPQITIPIKGEVSIIHQKEFISHKIIINEIQRNCNSVINSNDPIYYDITSSNFVAIDKIVTVKKHYKKWEKKQILSLLISPIVGNRSTYSGLRYGWGIDRYIHPNLFLSTSLSIVYQRTNSGFNTIISQSSFGLKTTTKYYGIQTKHLQYAHVPFLIGAKLNRHKISAGVGVNIYLGAFGKINQVDPDLGNPIKQIGKGWISSSYAKKFVPELAAYYSYKMKRMTLGASIHYYQDSFYDKPSLVNITPKKQWSIGLNLIYPLGKMF